MPKLLLSDLWMNPGEQQLRRMAVTKGTAPARSPLPGEEPGKFMRQALRL